MMDTSLLLILAIPTVVLIQGIVQVFQTKALLKHLEDTHPTTLAKQQHGLREKKHQHQVLTQALRAERFKREIS